jgi:cell division transport system permease protein
MNGALLGQHLFRVWSRHWALQIASVTIMTIVLIIMNFLFLGYSAFNGTVGHWGRALEMIVYLKEGTSTESLAMLREKIESSGQFSDIVYTSKKEATRRFLESLGHESLELMKDPKWKSPIPSSFELKLSDEIPADQRAQQLETWADRFRSFDYIEEVFYGQGWVENFSRFLAGARGLILGIWILSLSVGLMIVSNCIRLSFLQRREEIEILELVGATPGFIRTPFLLEGIVLGILASVLSLASSYLIHSLLLAWMGERMSFWLAVRELMPLKGWYVLANFGAGTVFGLLGAWYCVRKLNTGWSAAAG